MPFFKRDGLDFNYYDLGAGQPFFFQHGLGGEAKLVCDLFKPPAGIRMISFDARGHGETRPLGDPEKISIASFADDLGALMDHLKIESAIVGGISMGAAMALNFTLRFPQRVIGLVLSRPAWLDAPRPENVTLFGQIAQLIRQHGARRGRELFLQTEAHKNLRRDFPDTANTAMVAFNHPRAEETVVKLERIPNDTPCHDRAEWSAIRVPTLVLANLRDPIHPFEYGETLARLIPGATFRELTSKSISMEQHTIDVQRELETFLKTHFLGQ
ncbi:MAG: alpha/beta hydrolase [Verrucomicrobia bacterium]|nr:alpha/beta hydrolase [Verrucomicrobiota bacterium]